MSGSTLVLIGFVVLTLLLAGTVGTLFALHRRAARGRWILLVVGNAIAVLALLSLLLVGAEVYYRFIYDQSDGFQLSRVGQRWTERHYRLNNLGMRDDVDYALEPAPGKTRVTVVGDSYANGYGLADVEQRFANLLRAANSDWEVHVLARDGRETGALLRDLGKLLDGGYRIDYVVYAYVPNDISDLIPQWQEVVNRVYRERPGPLVEHSWAINTYYYRLRVASDPELSGYFDAIAQAHASTTWQLQRRRLSRLQALVTEHGGRLLVATFPFYESMDDPRCSTIHAQLSAFWEEIGVPHIDLLEAYRAYPLDEIIVNRFDTHPNSLAHRIAAEAIEKRLREMMAEPDPARDGSGATGEGP